MLKVNLHRLNWNYYHNVSVRTPICVTKPGETHIERDSHWPLNLCVTRILHTWGQLSDLGFEWSSVPVADWKTCFSEPVTSLGCELCHMTSAIGMKSGADWGSLCKNQSLAAFFRIRNVSPFASTGSFKKAGMMWKKSNLYRNLVKFT